VLEKLMVERYPDYATADLTEPTRDDRKEIIAGEVVAALCAHLGVEAIATGATSATTDEVQS
jgi:shikimate kinase